MFHPPVYPDIIHPGPSSQTTSNWCIAPEGPQIAVDSMSHNAGSAVIKAMREKSWNEAMEQVLQQRAQTWKELAAL
jgi:hypothetical protein